MCACVYCTYLLTYAYICTYMHAYCMYPMSLGVYVYMYVRMCVLGVEVNVGDFIQYVCSIIMYYLYSMYVCMCVLDVEVNVWVTLYNMYVCIICIIYTVCMYACVY